jgi:hypothetical protein
MTGACRSEGADVAAVRVAMRNQPKRTGGFCVGIARFDHDRRKGRDDKRTSAARRARARRSLRTYVPRTCALTDCRPGMVLDLIDFWAVSGRSGRI